MVIRTSTFRDGMVAWLATATLFAILASLPATAGAQTRRVTGVDAALFGNGTVGHAVQNVNHRQDGSRLDSRPHRRPQWYAPKPAQAQPAAPLLRDKPRPRRDVRHVPLPPQAGPGHRRGDGRPVPPRAGRDHHGGGSHAGPPPRRGPDYRHGDSRKKHRRGDHARGGHDHRYDHGRHGYRPHPPHHGRHGYRPHPPRHGRHYHPYPPHRHGKHYRRHPRHHHGRHYRPGYPRYWWRYYYNSYLAPYPIYVVPYRVVRTVPAPAYHRPGLDSAAYCDDGAAGSYSAGGSRQAGGTILGGVIGAAVGSQFGKGDGKLAAVGVGTLIGALIGADIGRSMDAADRAYAAGAMNRALETAPTCTTITWENPTNGHYGSVTPTETFETSPGRYCREFQQQVVIGGKLQDAYGTACRQPDGSWEIVAEQP